MMKDGFTNDFINDFEKYITSQFLGVNTSDEAKYKAILSKIKFMPKSGNTGPLGYILSDAGTYDVEIVIKYKNSKGSKKIFSGDNLGDNVSKIIIYMTLANRNINPLYQLPFDGKVGIDHQTINRLGYGIDFAPNSSGMLFNTSKADTFILDPHLATSSTPVARVNLRSDNSVDGVSNMETLNSARVKRGIVLEIGPASPVAGIIQKNIDFHLSKPYAVGMKWSKSSQGDGAAFYQVLLDGKPVNSGRSFLIWRQMCKNDGGKYILDNFENYDCEFFDGSNPVDHQSDMDVSGTHSKIATGTMKAYSYGLEIDKDVIIRDPEHKDVGMRSIVYAPIIAKNVSINKVSASDSVSFFTDDSASASTSTSATLKAPKDVPTLQSIEDVYNAVAKGWVCVSGNQNSSKLSFWWNPAKIFGGTEIGSDIDYSSVLEEFDDYREAIDNSAKGK